MLVEKLMWDNGGRLLHLLPRHLPGDYQQLHWRSHVRKRSEQRNHDKVTGVRAGLSVVILEGMSFLAKEAESAEVGSCSMSFLFTKRSGDVVGCGCYGCLLTRVESDRQGAHKNTPVRISRWQ